MKITPKNMKKISILSGLVLSLALTTTVMAAEIIVSDTTTKWSSDNINWQPAVATWAHPSWPSISGATWIWRTSQTDSAEEYANVPEGGWYFKRTFEVPQCSQDITGTISINSDNAEALYFNGVLIGSDGALSKDGPDTQAWRTVKTYMINPVIGTNTIMVRAINYLSSGSYTSNPAGLTFKATINYAEGDSDKDGVCDSEDLCFETEPDAISGTQRTNRWIWDGIWKTVVSKGKGPAFAPDLDYTYGCSCIQILDEMKDMTGSNFGGHYKHGCSKSVLEDWNRGT